MQHGYILQDDDGNLLRCTASLMHGEGKYSSKYSIITGIEVAQELRGKGYGSKLLKLILNDADNEGVTLLLLVYPDGSLGSLSAEELVAWYQRHGFGRTSRNSLMKRNPR